MLSIVDFFLEHWGCVYVHVMGYTITGNIDDNH